MESMARHAKRFTNPPAATIMLVLRCFVKKKPNFLFLNLRSVVGSSKAGKTTVCCLLTVSCTLADHLVQFIDQCIKDRGQESFLNTNHDVSHKSITTDTIKFEGTTGLDRRIIFREEPSLLAKPQNSCNIFKDFVKFVHECVHQISKCNFRLTERLIAN